MADNKTDNSLITALSSRYRIAVILTLLLLAFAGIFFWIFTMRSGLDLMSPATHINQPPPQTELQRPPPGPTVDLKEFLVNIISEDNSHYLKTTMTLEVSNSDTQKEVDARRAQVRDAILMLISNKTFEELYDLHGKKQLKAEITLTVNDLLTHGNVTAVYLTDFVVQ